MGDLYSEFLADVDTILSNFCISSFAKRVAERELGGEISKATIRSASVQRRRRLVVSKSPQPSFSKRELCGFDRVAKNSD